MGRLHQLAEALTAAAEVRAARETPQYAMGLRWLRDGVMPGGATNTRPELIVQLGDAEACRLVRVSQSALDDGTTRFEARFQIQPSRAHGAGVSVSGAMTEFFMAQAEDAPCQDEEGGHGLAAALSTVVEERRADIIAAFRALLVPDELVWRLVGWAQRDAWRVAGDTEVTSLAFGEPWLEQNRGETWLAKHWEVWIPVTIDVTTVLRRKA